MSKIIGFEHKSFTTKEGDTIEGTSIYITDKIPPQRGEGCTADRIFLSKNKLNDLSFVPAVGMEIEVLYNKYGKAAPMNTFIKSRCLRGYARARFLVWAGSISTSKTVFSR